MKPAKCCICRCEYVKARPLQKTCSIKCACAHVEQTKERKKGRADAEDRRQTREKLKAMETYPQLVKKAQTAFNSFIRQRDLGKPCISCGRPLSTEPNTHDAGHYRSVGSAPHMRFVESNTNSQCRHCNNYLGGNHVEYRKGLIARIGLKEVERIESDQTLRKYTKEALIEIARHYKSEAKRLLKERED